MPVGGPGVRVGVGLGVAGGCARPRVRVGVAQRRLGPHMRLVSMMRVMRDLQLPVMRPRTRLLVKLTRLLHRTLPHIGGGVQVDMLFRRLALHLV